MGPLIFLPKERQFAPNWAHHGRVIRKEDEDKSLLAQIDYAQQLRQEKELKTIANITSHDIEAFLMIAAEAGN